MPRTHVPDAPVAKNWLGRPKVCPGCRETALLLLKLRWAVKCVVCQEVPGRDPATICLACKQVVLHTKCVPPGGACLQCEKPMDGSVLVDATAV